MPDTKRVGQLDILRGLAVAGMILVTSPGDWNLRYAQLDHAAWNGWTLADMVFPTFLFSVGFALALAFPRATLEGRWSGLVRRCLLLTLLGLFLNALPTFDLAHLRLPGILQRIALCYALVASLLLLSARRDAEGRFAINDKAVVFTAAVILVGYWLALSLVPVPGFGAGRLDSHGSLPAWVDRAVFTTNHLWPYGTTDGVGVTYDPEGLVSTLPAAVNVLFGVLAARLFVTAPKDRRPLRLGIGAILLVIAGLALDPIIPINKRIWTSSFALFSSGFSMGVLALLLCVPDDILRRFGSPLRVLGGNAILAFGISQVLGALSGLPLLPGGKSPQAWGFSVASAIVPEAHLASLACAVAILALITLAIVPLHRRGVHLRL
jgi:predicted acyltransferase